MFSCSTANAEVPSHGCHEFIHRPAGMVTCHIVVEILPSSLDPIRVRAVGRQEMKLHAFSPSTGCRSDGLAAVNLEVVQHEVKNCLLAVPFSNQIVDQRNK